MGSRPAPGVVRAETPIPEVPLRSRKMRLVGHSIRLALFLLAGVMAVRYFLDALETGGWTPRAMFAFLLVTGAVSLIWRATLDLRKAHSRRRKA